MRRGSSRALLIASTIWVGLLAGGFSWLFAYGAQPGAQIAPPEQWPPGSQLERATDRPTLVMFAHPHCSCSKASLKELSRLLSRVSVAPRVHIAFAIPEDEPQDWRATELWKAASAVAPVFADEQSQEAERFGASTSGSIALYDAAGTLLFKGGITASRGHEGNNIGEERVVALLAGNPADSATSPVFGCALDKKDSVQ